MLDQYQNLIAQANTQAAQPLQQYTGNTVAPLSAQQNQAATEVQNAQGIGQPLYNQAAGLIQNASQQITPQTVNAADIQQYENPYTQQVLNSTMALENQQDAAQQSQVAGNAVQQGAWGGDRSAVAQALTAGQQALANNATNSGIESQGYSQALGEANTQQQAGLSAQEASQYLGQQGGQGLTNLGNQEQNAALQGAGALNTIGQQVQTENQANLNVPYENFLQQQAFPYQNLSWLSSLSTGLGSGEGGTSTSSTTQPAPNSIFGFARGGHVEGLIKRIASGGAVVMPAHYDRGGLIPHYDSGGSTVPGEGFNLTPGSTSAPPNLDTSVFTGLPMTISGNGSKLPNANSTPAQQPSALQQAATVVGLAGGINALLPTANNSALASLAGQDFAGGNVVASLPLSSVGNYAAADAADATASDFAAPSAIGGVSGLGSGLSSVGDALMAMFAKGGSVGNGLIRHYDDGGLVPSDTSTNPMANNMSSQFANMSTQQLQQVMPRIQNPQQKMLAQKVLQQKQMMPNAGGAMSNAAPVAPSAPQAGMARGGLIKRYAAAGTVDGPLSPSLIDDDNDLAPSLAPNPAPDTGGAVHLSSDDDNTDVAVPSRGLVVPPSANSPAASGLAQSAAPTAGANGFTPVPIPTFHDDKPINDVSPWLSVAAGVAGALSGKSPYVLQNLAGGALSGLESYGAQKKEAADETYKSGQIQDARDQLIREAQEYNATGQAHAKEVQDQLALEQQKADQAATYQKGELANQAAERQKPIPDGFGGFIIPNPSDPAHPTQVNMAGNSGMSPVAAVDDKGNPLTGDAYLATLDPRVARTAKMVADGDMAFPTGFALKSPYWQNVLGAVQQYDPTANANRFPAVKAFNTGQQGNQTRFLNVATAHLDTLDKLTDALDNNDTKALNTIGNVWKTQTGQTAPTNFDTAKQIVADEVTKAVIGAGGTGADRDKAAQVINAANSPEQLHQAVATYKTLMAGQLNGLQQQYEVSTGRKDFQDRYLTPQARAALNPQGSNTQPASIPLAPADPKQRIAGQVYTNPNGIQGKWTGTGWQTMTGAP